MFSYFNKMGRAKRNSPLKLKINCIACRCTSSAAGRSTTAWCRSRCLWIQRPGCGWWRRLSTSLATWSKSTLVRTASDVSAWPGRPRERYRVSQPLSRMLVSIGIDYMVGLFIKSHFPSLNFIINTNK